MGMKRPPPPFDKLAISDRSWARFRRLMGLMAGITLAVVSGIFILLYRELGAVSVHFYIATGLGVVGAMGLMSVLMGLVFLSNESGHDDTVIDPTADQSEEASG